MFSDYFRIFTMPQKIIGFLGFYKLKIAAFLCAKTAKTLLVSDDFLLHGKERFVVFFGLFHRFFKGKSEHDDLVEVWLVFFPIVQSLIIYIQIYGFVSLSHLYTFLHVEKLQKTQCVYNKVNTP